MVHGLKKFKEYFRDHTSQYVFIGGTASDIILDDLGAPFRATKDLDIVLIIEALDSSFGEIFRQFIEDGGYEHREKGSGKNQFYRFTKPKNSSYPTMIELFSKRPNNFNLSFDNGLTPIHIDDSIISLSAILLSDEYYDLLLKGKQNVEGYSIIEIEILILFKIKAWLDMKERKEAGKKVDTKNIKKHKNDVFRLLANVSPAGRIETPEEIQNDIIQFIELIKADKPDLKNLGIKGTSFEDMLGILNSIFVKNIEA